MLLQQPWPYMYQLKLTHWEILLRSSELQAGRVPVLHPHPQAESLAASIRHPRPKYPRRWREILLLAGEYEVLPHPCPYHPRWGLPLGEGEAGHLPRNYRALCSGSPSHRCGNPTQIYERLFGGIALSCSGHLEQVCYGIWSSDRASQVSASSRSLNIFIAEAEPARASAATLRTPSATLSSATTTATRMLRADGSLFASTAARIAFSGISFTARRSYRLRVRRSEPSKWSRAKLRQSSSVESDRSVKVRFMPPSSRRTTVKPTPGFWVQLRGFI